MSEAEIIHYIKETFPGAETQVADGNFFFFVGAERMMPFATLMMNAAYDQFSKLDRAEIYRLNMGVSKEAFIAQLGDASGGYGHDFAALDKLMPHPEYGKLFWVSVLNPGAATLETVKALLAEAYGLAEKRQSKR